MHRIWRSRQHHERNDKAFLASLRGKIADLPWMSDADVEAVVDRSERDRTILRASDVKRF